jgi:hypothetical protein
MGKKSTSRIIRIVMVMVVLSAAAGPGSIG